MGWEVGGRFKTEGTYVHLWLIHIDVWQKSTQYCKAIILQLNINKILKFESSLSFVITLAPEWRVACRGQGGGEAPRFVPGPGDGN